MSTRSAADPSRNEGHFPWVIQQGLGHVFGGDMADPTHRRLTCPRIAHMQQGLGKNLYLTLSVFVERSRLLPITIFLSPRY